MSWRLILKHGVEETQKALLEAEERRISLSLKLVNWGFKLEKQNYWAQRNQTTTSFDFQVLDVKKASQLEHIWRILVWKIFWNENQAYILDIDWQMARQNNKKSK